jgi:hypothetical protein
MAGASAIIPAVDVVMTGSPQPPTTSASMPGKE